MFEAGQDSAEAVAEADEIVFEVLLADRLALEEVCLEDDSCGEDSEDNDEEEDC